MTKYTVRISKETIKQDFLRALILKDKSLVIDPEGNPTTIWVTTKLSVKDIMEIPGVEFVVKSF